jgi:hypothetical protein
MNFARFGFWYFVAAALALVASLYWVLHKDLIR